MAIDNNERLAAELPAGDRDFRQYAAAVFAMTSGDSMPSFEVGEYLRLHAEEVAQRAQREAEQRAET